MCQKQPVCAVICELNPPHSGHELLFTRAKQGAGALVAVLSGNFVQRGEPALLGKYLRAACAMAMGADLVVLLPVSFACAGAERFALGGTAAAAAVGAQQLWFGSECGSVQPIADVARLLLSPAFSTAVKAEISRGIGFAQARSNAASLLLPGSDAILQGANNNLGVEYCKAILTRKLPLQPMSVAREGAGHDSTQTVGIPSAGYLRQKLLQGDTEAFFAGVAPCCKEILQQAYNDGLFPCSLQKMDCTMLYALRLLSAQGFAGLADVTEGLENRLYSAARHADSMREFYLLAKTKRYSMARLRRIAMHALLQLTHMPQQLPFLQVLGMNSTGAAMLKNAALPVLCRSSDAAKLSAAEALSYADESRADDIYGLFLPKVPPCTDAAVPRVLRA